MALADTHQIIALRKKLPAGRVSKKDVNRDLAALQKSDPDRSNVSVDVFARYLAPCRNHQNSTANWLKKQGLAWGFRGQVLVPNNKVPDVVAYLEDQRLHNEKLFREFLEALPGHMEKDKKDHQLGGLFDPNDYKTAKELDGKWEFVIMRDTVPDPTQDARAGWSLTQIEEMKKAMKEQEKANVKSATIELLARIEKPLKNVVDKMTRYEGGRDGRFNTKSFIGNIREVVETMISNNLQDDPELDSIRKAMIADICQLDTKELRDSEVLREDTKKKAQSILDRVGNFGASL